MNLDVVPLLLLMTSVLMVASVRRFRVALAVRRSQREKAEAAEYARIIGWVKKIRPAGAGPAIQRNKHGDVVLFKGLRRYARGSRRIRRSREA